MKEIKKNQTNLIQRGSWNKKKLRKGAEHSKPTSLYQRITYNLLEKSISVLFCFLMRKGNILPFSHKKVDKNFFLNKFYSFHCKTCIR